MTRTILDTQLHEITTRIIQIGTLVETALSHVLQAVQNGDQALCSLVIASDPLIDNLRFEAERLTLQSLAGQQPLAGRDLRFLMLAPSIMANLERAGDNSAGIATLLLRMIPLLAAGTSQIYMDPDGFQKRRLDRTISEDSIISELLDLGQEARRMLQGTMCAFEQSDAHAARMMWQEDDIVDVRYHQVRHDVMTMLAGMHTISALQQDSLIMQRMTYWLLIAHKLERVGDHSTNICKRIAFILEGNGTMQPEELV
jgi:phosphate transport system protein